VLAGSIGVAVTLGGTVLLAAPVWADSGTVDASAAACAPTVVITPTTGTNHGGTILVSLSGECVNSTFNVVAKNKPVGSVTTDTNGNGLAEILLPCRVGPGTQDIVITDTSGATAATASVVVTSGPCASAPGHLKNLADLSAGASNLATDHGVDPASVATNASTDAAPDPGMSASDVAAAG
jgi:hypothetical protein